MARIADSKMADLSGYEPVETSGAMGITVAPPPAQNAPSPLMLSSLPSDAAGQDQLTRQFYGRTGVPMRRIFQVTE